MENDISNSLNITRVSAELEFPENIVASLKKEGCYYPGISKAEPVDYEALQREADRDTFY